MPHIINVDIKDVFGKKKYKSPSGNTECAEFVRQTTDLGPTSTWKPGVKVSDAKAGSIPSGAAIATFDEKEKYPTDTLGKHAAIYLSHSKEFIWVLDQWNSQGEVKKRPIKFKVAPGTKRSNDANTFYVIK